ncbi:hypothetical protein DC429_15770 [Arthrobacter sp. TPD3018]|nr:hypothetical protein DC425_15145 [Sphingomonas sp. TPD3009]PVE52969.1 hypothetical protein DC429_15770 [Arthrobacter sp. TPD3018]PVE81354.1 hypothetical protein DC431_15155 [Sphingomonas melonis]
MTRSVRAGLTHAAMADPPPPHSDRAHSRSSAFDRTAHFVTPDLIRGPVSSGLSAFSGTPDQVRGDDRGGLSRQRPSAVARRDEVADRQVTPPHAAIRRAG